jgi:hypothetical protein
MGHQKPTNLVNDEEDKQALPSAEGLNEVPLVLFPGGSISIELDWAPSCPRSTHGTIGGAPTSLLASSSTPTGTSRTMAVELRLLERVDHRHMADTQALA